jgi:D-glycero-D-manno-heptose 1,7-bisphosphate phosphatase
MNKAVFLDRDGVIIEEEHYLCEPEKIRLIPGAEDAIKRLRNAGYMIVIITNQAGIARGYYEEADAIKVNDHIKKLLADAGVKIDGIYMCPHHPDHSGECDCRKPAPGMLLQAAQDLAIDCSASYMIGDKMSDLGAAFAAGCAGAVLVLTGHGKEHETEASESGQKITASIVEAVDYLLTLSTID